MPYFPITGQHSAPPQEPATRSSARRVSCLLSRPSDRAKNRTLSIYTNAGKARFDRERRLWAESRERELQLVDGLLAPWAKRLVADRVPGNEMLEHNSAPELLDGVAQWCREYTRWREECGLAFIEGYPVEGWVGQVPPERRAAVLFRIANHVHGLGETERAWMLRRWAVQSLLDEYAGEQ